MFAIAILIGLYSYLIFFLGLSGFLYKEVINIVTLFFIVLFILFFYKHKKFNINLNLFKNKLIIVFSILLLLQGIINLIGVMSPELSFDALWYHLTLPKLYLLNHAVYNIPGGLLYYSVMPKLSEMLYIGGLSLGNENAVKAIHFSFGVLTTIAIFIVTRKFLPILFAFIAAAIFYANIVVAWESTTAYIDLIRAFFEIMALWSFITWWSLNRNKWLILSALMMGFSITTKVLALGSLGIFILLIIFKSYKEKKINLELFKRVGLYVIVALIIPLPWFIFAFIQTGNPVYPFFSSIYSIAPEPFSIVQMPIEIFNVLTFASDPISPIYLIFIPLVFLSFSKLKMEIKVLGVYSLLAIVLWYFTPRTGGGRFLLPYLPAFSIFCSAMLYEIYTKKEYKFLYRFFISIIIFVSIVTIGYRFAASIKYIPVLVGQQTKQEFLTTHLDFAFGDFYDTDNYFSEHIKPTDRVLLSGFHNLYYVEFSFIDSSWVKKGDTFNYVAIQKSDLPTRFKYWQLIYTNAKTMVKLYKPPKGLCEDLCVY
jgi:hypothetical protein